MDIKSLFSRMGNKIGPLPAWAWAAIPAGAYVILSYYRASRADVAVSDIPVEDGAAGTDEEWYGVNPGFGGTSLPGYASAATGSSNAVPPVETPRYDNQTWFRQVSNWLISEGVLSTDIVTALNAYLYGSPEAITEQQMDALQRGLIRYGAAPDPAFVPQVVKSQTVPAPAPSAPAPTPAPAPAPAPAQPVMPRYAPTRNDPNNWYGIARALGDAGDPNYAGYRQLPGQPIGRTGNDPLGWAHIARVFGAQGNPDYAEYAPISSDHNLGQY